MISKSPTTAPVAGQGTDQLVNSTRRHALCRRSPLRVAGIFVAEFFTVYAHGAKRATFRA
ncbi:hypothetical protein AB833_11730 [Chromatiales bacterium (ex Bugula neritina AB1)]|nr:hypothetical protein AB833_11730 [Chromatiales bacterium (ex Bugula neritina AB1)]